MAGSCSYKDASVIANYYLSAVEKYGKFTLLVVHCYGEYYT